MSKTKPNKVMLPQKPENWPSLFEQNLNAGDLEAVVALYEPDARLVARSGETVVARDRIRDALGGLIKSKTRLQSPDRTSSDDTDLASTGSRFEDRLMS